MSSVITTLAIVSSVASIVGLPISWIYGRAASRRELDRLSNRILDQLSPVIGQGSVPTMATVLAIRRSVLAKARRLDHNRVSPAMCVDQLTERVASDPFLPADLREDLLSKFTVLADEARKLTELDTWKIRNRWSRRVADSAPIAGIGVCVLVGVAGIAALIFRYSRQDDDRTRRARDAVEKQLPLDGFDLSHAHLRGMNFDELSLRGVIFHGADVRGASFRNADLSGSDFTHAELGETEIAGIDVRGARLTGVQFPVSTIPVELCFDESTVWPAGFEVPKTPICRGATDD